MSGLTDVASIKRQLQIKTGEESSYLTEAKQQEERIQKFIDEERDEYDVKQQRSVLADTLKMIPDCRKRLQLAADDLVNYVEGVQEEPEVASSSEFSAAKQLLSDTQLQLESDLPAV
ncbi:related to Tubulin-specific chaperone A [Sporisorium scitamineum]|uniref:Tubulin-specific chaperone A n=1 Tax=Sporisorium scitamineum TaxID=49012 RepID=A0A140KN84_9BASI|nr:related to Tubulin-specific chaperone A [Sporisorium scitamineum]